MKKEFSERIHAKAPEAFWLQNLRSFQSLTELRKSSFFAANGAALQSYLRTPQVFSNSSAKPLLHSFIRIVQWNIEKGKRFDEILEKLRTDEILRWADVIILNEADRGMIRSGNRDVARELAEALGMNAAFGPAHYELTKGTEEDLVPGENCESLQGNAVLSRYPIAESRVVPLPVTFEPYEFEEKRFGWRTCVWVRLKTTVADIWIGSVHLELRNTPQCRAQQVQHILQNLPGSPNNPVFLAGDLNSNSFGRGTKLRTVKSVARLLLHSPDRVKLDLLHPEAGHEPLFEIVKRSGFEWNRLNSNEETARSAMGSLEEAAHLPDAVLRYIQNKLEAYQGYLCFKLDWMFGRNVRALGYGQTCDLNTGVLSLNPGVVKGKNYGPDRISDHLPIYADIDFGGPEHRGPAGNGP